MTSVSSSHHHHHHLNPSPPPPGGGKIGGKYDCGYEYNSAELTSQEITERFADLQENTIHMQAAQQGLTSRLNVLKQDQEAANLANNDTFAKLASLLATTKSLSESFEVFEKRSFGTFQQELVAQRTEWLQAARCQTKQYEDEVRKLLENFKSEIIAVSRESEVRHEHHRADMADLTAKLGQALDAQEVIRQDHEKVFTAVENLSAQVQGFEASITKRVDALEKLFTRSIDQALVMCEENRSQIERAHTTTQQSVTLCKEESRRFAEESALKISAAAAKDLEAAVTAINDSQTTELVEMGEKVRLLERSLENKIDEEVVDLSTQISETNQDIANVNTKVGELKDSHDTLNVRATKNFGALETEMSAQLKTLEDLSTAVQNSSDAAVEELLLQVSTLKDTVATTDKQLTTLSSTVQLMTSATDRRSAESKDFEDSILEKLEAMQQRLDARWGAHTEAQSKQLQIITSDLEKRHSVLTHSTKDAIAQLTVGETSSAALAQTLQQEINDIKDKLHSQQSALQEVAASGDNQRVTSELQDWIRDLSGQFVSRTTVEEALGTLTQQLNELRDQSRAAENTLSSRLDAERVARERDTKQVREQAERLLSVSK